jgi:hypothetical protein
MQRRAAAGAAFFVFSLGVARPPGAVYAFSIVLVVTPEKSAAGFAIGIAIGVIHLGPASWALAAVLSSLIDNPPFRGFYRHGSSLQHVPQVIY